MTADGLRPGQAWAIAPGGAWQARIGRDGRAHVIGRELAGHPDHGPRYADPGRADAGDGSAAFQERKMGPLPWWRMASRERLAWARPRPWHTFERACRAARMHSRMVIAAKRNAAQAGQNGSGQ